MIALSRSGCGRWAEGVLPLLASLLVVLAPPTETRAADPDGLYVTTASRTATSESVATSGVTRVVGQQFTLPGGQGTVNLTLSADGSTSIAATIGGTTITNTSPGPLGSLDPGDASGVTPPSLPALSFAGLPEGTSTVAATTVRRDDGQVVTKTYDITVTIQAGTAYVDGTGSHTTAASMTTTLHFDSEADYLAALNDPNGSIESGSLVSVGVISGRIDFDVVDTTTTTNNYTDVTFTDQVIVSTASVADLIALLAEFPDIVAALEALLPSALPTSGLTPNQRAVAENLDAIAQLPGFAGSPLEGVVAALAALPPDAYAAALDQLHPEPYDAWTFAAIAATRAFHDGIARQMAGARHSGGPAGTDDADGQGWRLWGDVSGGGLLDARTTANAGFAIGGVRFEGGVQRQVDPALVIGLALLYGHDAIIVDSRASGGLDTIMAGLYGGWTLGPFAFDLSGALSQHSGEVTRMIGFSSISGATNAAPGWTQVSAQALASWTAELQAATVRPYAGLFGSAWSGYAITETGTGPALLAVTRGAGGVLETILGVEISTTLPLGEGGSLSPFLDLSWRHALTDPDRALGASFLAAPPGATPFLVAADGDADVVAVQAGATADFGAGVTLSLAYQGAFSASTLSHGATLGLRGKF